MLDGRTWKSVLRVVLPVLGRGLSRGCDAERRPRVDHRQDAPASRGVPGERHARRPGSRNTRRPRSRGLSGDTVSQGRSAAWGEDEFLQPFRSGYQNLLAKLPGSDAELSDEVVIISGHFDHVGSATPATASGRTARFTTAPTTTPAARRRCSKSLGRSPRSTRRRRGTVLFACGTPKKEASSDPALGSITRPFLSKTSG